MSNTKYIGVSQDGKYVFTSKGIYSAKGHGAFTKFDRDCLPKLIEVAQDNNEYELKKGLISLQEYATKPRKILESITKSLPKSKSNLILKEWDFKYGKNFIIKESVDNISLKTSVNESFENIKSVFLEQSNVYQTAIDISNKIISALSKTFNDDEEEVLKQVKRINNIELLDSVERVIKSKKGMNLINYLNDEMSDVDWEYKSIYNHLKSLKSTYSKGYKENKLYQSVGKGLDTAAKVGTAISDAAKAIIFPIIKKGVIPFLRWIRRSLNTYAGIIADVILSVLPTVVVMKVVWGMIVLLDIYEISTGDFDPDDPDRKNMPYFFLIVDIISLAFTAAAGKAASLALKGVLKSGKVTTSAGKGVLTKALKAMPIVKNALTYVKKFLNKFFGTGNLVSKLFGYVDNIITKVTNWIGGMLGQTAKTLGTKKGIATAAVSAGLGVGMAEFLAEKSFGEGKSGIYGSGKEVRTMQERLKQMTDEKDEFSVGYVGPITGTYDKKTGDAVYKLYSKLKMTPKRTATPYIMTLLGVQLQPSGIFKIIPQEYQVKFGDAITKTNKYFSDLAKKTGLPSTT
jgi:hypothetical protein